ncbi:MAG: 1,4-dihydroxy-2-naphthoate octaprenyltransferase [Nonlabens sp.]
MSSTAKFKSWISAARLRTLPLSISGIIMGSSCAYLIGSSPIYLSIDTLNPTIFDPSFKVEVLCIGLLGLITTLCFQILSNFANDYGDGVKGTDNDKRIGPTRAVQSGHISSSQMKTAIIVTAIISFISAISLIIMSLGLDQLLIALVFLALGILAIWAAIKYTVGDDAYGYSGLGDLFVFIFFGPVSVMGIYFLILKTLNVFLILPSLTIGLLSVAVLNLNNMRDVENDKFSGKNTLVVKVGLKRARIFHIAILAIAFICAYLYASHLYLFLDKITRLIYLPLIAFIPIVIHSIKVVRNKVPALFDPELKKVALSTFLYSLLFVGITIYFT